MEKEKKKKDNNPQQESKKKKIIIFTLLIIFITLLIFWISWRKNLLKITLVGNDEIILEVNSSYQEGSAKATYLTDDISSKITMNHNVDVTKLGTYYETYQITYRGIQKEIKRTIIVQDTTAPELLLNGEEETKNGKIQVLTQLITTMATFLITSKQKITSISPNLELIKSTTQ